MYEVMTSGDPSSRDALFPDWDRGDRFGIVIHEPLGAMGASNLIGLAITAYYDWARSGPEAFELHYPELYVVHVGGRYGDHNCYDAWPPRKEVVVEADPAAVLAQINHLGITYLAVPDGSPEPTDHWWADLGCARRRVRACFAYNAGGRVENPDIEVRGVDAISEENSRLALRGASIADEVQHDDDPEMVMYGAAVASRLSELSGDDLARVRARHEGALESGLPVETYRRISLDAALGLLVPHETLAADGRFSRASETVGRHGIVPRASWSGGLVPVDKLPAPAGSRHAL
jgi:hypothetical protein